MAAKTKTNQQEPTTPEDNTPMITDNTPTSTTDAAPEAHPLTRWIGVTRDTIKVLADQQQLLAPALRAYDEKIATVRAAAEGMPAEIVDAMLAKIVKPVGLSEPEAELLDEYNALITAQTIAAYLEERLGFDIMSVITVLNELRYRPSDQPAPTQPRRRTTDQDWLRAGTYESTALLANHRLTVVVGDDAGYTITATPQHPNALPIARSFSSDISLSKALNKSIKLLLRDQNGTALAESTTIVVGTYFRNYSDMLAARA